MNLAAKAAASAALLALTAQGADALTLCNRTSYRLDAALGLERTSGVTTRGWFALDPGQCRKVLHETLDSASVYLHSRVPAVYGSSPVPQSGGTELCVGEREFNIAQARACRGDQQMARFSPVRPSDSESGPVAKLGEQAEYSDEQARLAGVQRLLSIAGYDPGPIDGVTGSRTEAALAKFLKDRQLAADAASKPDFFDALMKAALNPEGFGFTWCNDTATTVMAAVGVPEGANIVTRGWYRVEAGRCVRPDLRGNPARAYSYAEAVDSDGRALKRGGSALTWGGGTVLCTREGRFELNDQKDCSARGLGGFGFATVELSGQPAATVRFKETQ